jgi:DNA-binding CsgD family transcriptional regulator/GAF domain-containing protein
MRSTRRAEGTRSTEPARGWSAAGAHVPRENAAEVSDIVETATSLLSWDDAPEASDVADFRAARGALDQVSTLAHDALLREAHAADELADVTGLAELCARTRKAGGNLADARARTRTDAVKIVRDALRTMHGARSVSQLIEIAPRAVCRIGFDRAILSRIADSMWVTEKIHVNEDPAWAAEICAAGQANPQKLTREIFESEMVRRGVPLRVTDVQHDPHVHRPVAEASLSRSYVAAPVMPEGHVIGFIHADRYLQRRDVDEFDRDLLAVFAEGFGYVLQRAVLLDRLAELREKVTSLTYGIASAMDDGPDEIGFGDLVAELPGVTSSAHPTAAPEYFAAPAAARSPLTPRETDVLRRLAKGETNSRIASRLVISDGTVKSHIKHILRKLGAANRAEAVSKYLRIEQDEQRRCAT